jgi:pyrroloquinoline quinone biosynthesis protein B
MMWRMAAALSLLLGACTTAQPVAPVRAGAVCEVEFVILGVAQDAGIPQIGNAGDPAWKTPALARMATSAALVDHRTGRRFLFEATPDVRRQLAALDARAAPREGPLGLSGVFLTHAHIGHYAGLMFFGHESAGVTGLSVHVLPRMRAFLSGSGPWSQLVAFGNIRLDSLEADRPSPIGADLSVTPLLVPHRDEFSETAGFVVRGPSRSVLFLPDIDGWDLWETRQGKRLEEVVRGVDFAYLDATFFDDGELPGRDMSKVPHPRVPDTMSRLAGLSADKRAGVRFIHMNHTNPLRYGDSAEARRVRAAGFGIAQEGEAVCLSGP